MKSITVSFFVHDLAGNAIVRAAPLVEALRADGYCVEIIGLLMSGRDVYKPFIDRFDYKTIQLDGTLKRLIPKLARMAEGDLIYACKPLVTSFLPALLASGFGRKKPLLLDVEDNELWVEDQDRYVGLNRWPFLIKKYWWLRSTYALHPLKVLATSVSVVSTQLQKTYGGSIILNGPDEAHFDPERVDLKQKACRAKFGLPTTCPLVLFAGIPHRHKGLETLVQALAAPELQHVHLILAGPPEHEGFIRASTSLKGRAICLGLIPYSDMPHLLAAVDIVPTPQMENDFTRTQIPAKLLEGMAMGKSVIASRVSDLPLILGEAEPNLRGWLFNPGDSAGLASCIIDVIKQPNQASHRNQEARHWFRKNASINAIRERLRPLMERCVARL